MVFMNDYSNGQAYWMATVMVRRPEVSMRSVVLNVLHTDPAHLTASRTDGCTSCTIISKLKEPSKYLVGFTFGLVQLLLSYFNIHHVHCKHSISLVTPL